MQTFEKDVANLLLLTVERCPGYDVEFRKGGRVAERHVWQERIPVMGEI